MYEFLTGLIDFMISSHPLAGILRDHVMIVVIPMINPDGVFIGNYRQVQRMTPRKINANKL